ncbi:MAG: HD superfamily phosphohydrolase [Sphingobacteriales bacterium]
MNKKKIFNDPVYGFISIPHNIIFDLIEHKYFQRLRNISQLGLTSLVYPGALHTRFHHALGAMHLMQKALMVIQSKGHEVTEDEKKAATIAILLHDIGHGPFSHALEASLVNGVSHENISSILIQNLNKEFDGQLDMALQIFQNQHPKPYLHQLVSSQLDMDRMDYLNRDSFYTGVSEGVIGFDRILAMLTVHNQNLVVEEKAIYSIEKFLVARRLMYWQVYLHKTVLSAEKLLVNILKRAKYLALQGETLFASSSLHYFLYKHITKQDFETDEGLEAFNRLDDHDFFTSIKEWAKHKDPVLSKLCYMLINRKLYKIKLQDKPFSKSETDILINDFAKKNNLTEEEAGFFVFTGITQNNAYNLDHDNITMLRKDGTTIDVASASDNLNIRSLASPVEKYFLCYFRG